MLNWDLKKINNLAILVSTHGIGEPPVQAEDLHEFLHGKKAFDLSHINYAVLSLGDSSYVDFCQTGKDRCDHRFWRRQFHGCGQDHRLTCTSSAATAVE